MAPRDGVTGSVKQGFTLGPYIQPRLLYLSLIPPPYPVQPASPHLSSHACHPPRCSVPKPWTHLSLTPHIQGTSDSYLVHLQVHHLLHTACTSIRSLDECSLLLSPGFYLAPLQSALHQQPEPDHFLGCSKHSSHHGLRGPARPGACLLPTPSPAALRSWLGSLQPYSPPCSSLSPPSLSAFATCCSLSLEHSSLFP